MSSVSILSKPETGPVARTAGHAEFADHHIVVSIDENQRPFIGSNWRGECVVVITFNVLISATKYQRKLA
ncbi:hypothetical protein D3C77_644050 [compost metagenome]